VLDSGINNCPLPSLPLIIPNSCNVVIYLVAKVASSSKKVCFLTTNSQLLRVATPLETEIFPSKLYVTSKSVEILSTGSGLVTTGSGLVTTGTTVVSSTGFVTSTVPSVITQSFPKLPFLQLTQSCLNNL